VHLRRRPGVLAVLAAAILLVAGLATTTTASAAAGGVAGPSPAAPLPPGAEVDPATVLVRFADPGRAAAVLAHHGLHRRAEVFGVTAVATDGRDPAALARTLRAEPGVESVEPDLVRRATTTTPNDGEVPAQLPYLDEVRLRTAWDVSKGSSGRTIAVIDTGVDLTHPDLLAHLAGPGYDFTVAGGVPGAQDQNGHGTMVAGIAAATTDNVLGVAGAAWDARLLPVRVLDGNGAGSDLTVAQGIDYAIAQHVQVINLSLGGYGSTSLLQDAVKRAVDAGIVIVAAAGNLSGSTQFKEPVYPAAYPGVLGVGATDHAGRAVYFTLHGPWVDVAAPGSQIRSTALGGGYATGDGTSFASPLVAGAAVLVEATFPALTRAEVLTQLTSTAHDAGIPGRDDVYGAGILDAAAAVGAAPVQAARTPAPGDAYEPDDSPASPAPVLAVTGGWSASIAPEGDADWYRVALPAASHVTVTVVPNGTFTLTAGLDPILRVRRGATVVADRDAVGVGGLESVTFDTGAAADHLLGVENFLPTLGGAYSLFLSASPLTASATSTTTTTAPPTTTTSPPPAPAPAPAPSRSGDWMVSAAGDVYGFGDARDLGRTGPLPAGRAAVDLEPTPTMDGYWITTDSGHVYAFGDAPYLGGVNGFLGAGESVTSISATPSGRGYWLFTTRGRVVAFGDAPFLGDMSATRLNGPVLDSIPSPSGRGYYLVASDGGIFTFGDAAFRGSMGDTRLNAPVQSLVPDADGVGYWLVASDGGIFSFEAPFRGSMGSVRLNGPVTGMVRFGDGYLMVGTDGGIFTFSSKPFYGSLGDHPPASPIVSVAAAER
jgi:type VII secretion-associated serine protease mycosin